MHNQDEHDSQPTALVSIISFIELSAFVFRSVHGQMFRNAYRLKVVGSIPELHL